jgi:hypothetical protein
MVARVLPPPRFFGIVIEQSLADPAFAETLDVVFREKDPNGDWVFLIVRVEPELLAGELERLRLALAGDEVWYAHFFSRAEIAVVYPDAIVRMTTDSASWTPAIEHGLALGIPIEQLDFSPNTVEQAEERFGISLTEDSQRFESRAPGESV